MYRNVLSIINALKGTESGYILTGISYNVFVLTRVYCIHMLIPYSIQQISIPRPAPCAGCAEANSAVPAYCRISPAASEWLHAR